MKRARIRYAVEHGQIRRGRERLGAEELRAKIEALACPEPNTGCHLWTAGGSSGGYGTMATGLVEKELVHRVAFEVFVGAFARELDVLHRCDTPACVNPEHLFLGTARDNALDSVAKGRHARAGGLPKRTHCLKGHPLTPENTIVHKLGRQCRLCNNARRAAWARERRRQRKEGTSDAL